MLTKCDIFRLASRRGRHLVAGMALLCLFAISGCGDPEDTDPKPASSVKGVAVKPMRAEEAATSAFLLVNNERMGRGMPPLDRRADLDAVAYAHARDLLRMDKLSHVSSDGRHLENRLAKLDWIWAGENLARNKGFDAPSKEAVRGWINSPKHYENMFRSDFSQTGMAALYDPNSGFTYFVQVFILPVD